jgi:hypothetical protein
MTTAPGGTRPGAAAAVVVLAVAVDMFLYGSLVPLVPVLPAVDGSPAAAGALFAAYAVALLAVTPWSGTGSTGSGREPRCWPGCSGWPRPPGCSPRPSSSAARPA